MTREVKLNQLDEFLADLEYPVDHDDVLSDHGDVTLVLADGQELLSAVLENSSVDRFESADDLSNEIMGFLPREAVGEPFQSEGEG